MSDAIKFIQQKGLDAAKELVNFGTGFVSVEDGLSFHTDQLISLIQSHELVEKHGGLPEAKKYNDKLCDDNAYFSTIESNRYGHKLWQAIKDVEACQGAAQ